MPLRAGISWTGTSLEIFPLQLSFTAREQQEVKGTVKKLSLGKEPPPLFQMDLKGSYPGGEVVREAKENQWRGAIESGQLHLQGNWPG